MPAPSSATYSAAALVAAQNSFKTLVDAGTGPGMVRFRTSADALLATATLNKPSGAVNSGTGQLTLSVATQATATAAGTAAYGEICDSAGTVCLSLPVQAGSSAVSGYLVLNTVTFVSGAAVNIVSATIG